MKRVLVFVLLLAACAPPAPMDPPTPPEPALSAQAQRIASQYEDLIERLRQTSQWIPGSRPWNSSDLAAWEQLCFESRRHNAEYSEVVAWRARRGLLVVNDPQLVGWKWAVKEDYQKNGR